MLYKKTYQQPQLKMFTMILLHIVLLFSVINVSFQELPTTRKVPDKPQIQPYSREVISNEDLRLQICEQNTRIEEHKTRFAQQNARFAHQNTKFAVQNTKLAELDITMLEQNTKIKNLEMKIEELVKVEGRDNQLSSRNMAQQNIKFAVQNTKLAELDITILEQNTKIKNLEMKIEELVKVEGRDNQLSSRNMAQQNTTFAVQNTKLAELDNTILEQNTKIKNLEMKIEELEKLEGRENQTSSRNNSTSKGTGSIFTRWGRRDCPRNISQLVYSGLTGGSYYKHTGGAAEYVCLPPDPIWNVNKDFIGPYWGYMYGSEYENIPMLMPMSNFNVPCAVCRTSQFSTVLMIPARTECYQGWQEAYHGELVSGYFLHPAASQYVCLDDDPQKNGTNSDNDGKLMYPVRAKCGSLPCPPYEDNTLLTCVVCLK